MSWICPSTLTCIAVLLALSSLYVADGGSLSDRKVDKKATGSQGGPKQIFLQDDDASHFFKRRDRRAVKSPDEINAEQTQRLAADERKREYHEEQRNEFENFGEEQHDEQDERSRESTEQWRQYHHDGLDPPYEYNRHSV